jgi:DNA-binding NtrC family response regulator
MQAENTETTQSDTSNPERRSLRTTGTHSPLRMAERPARNRVQRLAELASTLSKEVETLASDRAFTEEANKLRTMNLAEGIDFYKEVTSFEVNLIKLALEHTGRNQAAAARLLHIKATTLNFKIKLYGIEY